MRFDASHALRFINRVRAASGLPALAELPFTGAVRADERACLLARALQAEVGGSTDPRFGDHFVVRLGDQALARAAATRTGQPCNGRAEVLLPEPLARLAAAFDRGEVQRRGARYVLPGQLSFDDLETDACQAAAAVGDSSAGHSTKREHTISAARGGRAGGGPTRAERTPPGPRAPTTTPPHGAPWLVASECGAMQPLADRVVLADVGRGHPIYFAPVAATPGFAEPLFRLVREPRRGAMTPGREASMSAGRCAF